VDSCEPLDTQAARKRYEAGECQIGDVRGRCCFIGRSLPIFTSNRT
jgi:hypothetical protein